jgi:leucyl-tRNA synthetase
MADYNPREIEAKWQKKWLDEKVFAAHDEPAPGAVAKPKYYQLETFPYPSGAGLHVGHPKGYIAEDIHARFMRMGGLDSKPREVLYTMGWDAFGLPTENYAIKIGKTPQEVTRENTDNFRRQVRMFGLSYDWDREINTSSPDYYKWTQWLFIKLFERGLAYRKASKVNWCPVDQTVLANEQVINGHCDRCGSEIEERDMEQWFLKITDYADRLLEDLRGLDWPAATVKRQEDWIGRSEGAEISFALDFKKNPADNDRRGPDGERAALKIFTTRPDTLFGATYLVLAPEHPWVTLAIDDQHDVLLNKDEIRAYVEAASHKTELMRKTEEKDKTGVELKGVKAINPANGEEIPIWVADYVLGSYGTGAIMAVPAHDERDFEFAKKFGLPIKIVVNKKMFILTNQIPAQSFDREGLFKDNEIFGGEGVFMSSNDGGANWLVGSHNLNKLNKAGKYFHQNFSSSIMISNPQMPFLEEGLLESSAQFDGLDSESAKWKITEFVGGTRKTQYRIRDWSVSRQRYWGAPIPMIHCPTDGIVPVPVEELPVILPPLADFRPKGMPPLAGSPEFMNVKCPKCGGEAQRDPETLDTFVDSSWYYLRYTDPHNAAAIFDPAKAAHWLPADLYVIGAEHTVLHLLYSRFITKFLQDEKLIKFGEPFLKLRHQGLIRGTDGAKMSKSKGNVVNPDEIVAEFGADTVRMYEMFMGPFEDGAPWEPKSILGIERFLKRFWKYASREAGDNETEIKGETRVFLHKTIKKVGEDIEGFKFNTAISALMILLNELEKRSDGKKLVADDMKSLLKLLHPFAPHMAQELWSQTGATTYLDFEPWPPYDPALIREEKIKLALQVNGKTRDVIEVAADGNDGLAGGALTEATVKQLALENDKIKKILNGAMPKKVIYVERRLVNIVI